MEHFDFIDRWGNLVETYFTVTSYATNGNLAILLLSQDPDLEGLGNYAGLTCNIDSLPPLHAAVDTNNLSVNVVVALEEQGIAQQTGYVSSGFCIYPIMEFNSEALLKYDPEGTKEYLTSVGLDKSVITKDFPAVSLNSRAQGAKKICDEKQHYAPDRNIDMDER